jgi:argonaute-like protein implicated in RNA metabolism and viral defense
VSDSHSFRKGQTVKWHWGSGTAEGKVADKFERRVQRTIKGSKIIRNGSKENPAYLIEQDDGDRVLKLGSELEAS